MEAGDLCLNYLPLADPPFFKCLIGSVLRYGPHWICFEGGGSLIRGLSYARRLTNSNQGGHSSRPRRGEHPLAEDAGLQTLVP